MFFDTLASTIKLLSNDFDSISAERKALLRQITEFVQEKNGKNLKCEMIFICTHNSRRSHISQIWAQTAAAWYNVPNVVCYSGGTEATAFNPRAVKAIEEVGFEVQRNDNDDNPVYEVAFSEDFPAVIAFSKKYDGEANPQKNFAAVMTCTHADENCPVVIGMEKRISLPYDDPKEFDGTPLEKEKYAERVREIGTEILWAFSQVKTK
jgi:arsenate reductase (thioredoxin)